jgi:hypothetical protein
MLRELLRSPGRAGGAPDRLEFTDALRAAIEPEIAKSREARAAVWAGSPTNLIEALDGPQFKPLRERKQLRYDPDAYPLRDLLAELLNLPVALEDLHTQFQVVAARRGGALAYGGRALWGATRINRC